MYTVKAAGSACTLSSDCDSSLPSVSVSQLANCTMLQGEALSFSATLKVTFATQNQTKSIQQRRDGWQWRTRECYWNLWPPTLLQVSSALSNSLQGCVAMEDLRMVWDVLFNTNPQRLRALVAGREQPCDAEEQCVASLFEVRCRSVQAARADHPVIAQDSCIAVLSP